MATSVEGVPPRATRRRTSTSNFGVGRREGHDATAFYGRFRPPELSDADTVLAPIAIAEPFVVGDARHMDGVADGSVALVVTSPPYFAGKQYEEELAREGVPSSYLEYLGLLREVFAECARKLEPGGRIAVNVANLGRKPYRSLASDVVRILQDDLGLLLRGEIVWQKAVGASGSCAWGSFRSATNPVLRDITERVVVASKGRFDRARSAKQRQAEGLPHESTLSTEDFMALSLDVWSVPPESARRVGHPAPFPVELPEKLIALYTFVDDLVLDPFMGSGSSLVAAATTGRRYVGYDLDPEYANIAERRVREALAGRSFSGAQGRLHFSGEANDGDEANEANDGDGRSRRAGLEREGKAARSLAEDVLDRAGFTVTARSHRIRGTGVTADFAARDALGDDWLFDVGGPFTRHRGGMLVNDVVWRALGRAHAIRGGHPGGPPFVVLTTQLPRRPGEGDTALRAAGPEAIFDLIDVLEEGDEKRLARYGAGHGSARPLPGFWTAAECARR